MKGKREIYLDGAANTPLDPRVFKAMRPYMTGGFCGNSQSAHRFGEKADKAVAEAREKIAVALGVDEDEVFFTSGATEGNNWVIKGLALHQLTLPREEQRKTIICSAIEHASVLQACKSLEPLGFRVIYVRPDATGRITQKSINQAMKGRAVLLVCVMATNNETGVSNDVDAIAFQAHKHHALMLADATQDFSYGCHEMSITAKYPRVDYITLSGHKLYGPTGTGLLIRRGNAPLYPLLSGGAQENGLRGGTHNVAGIVGLSKAIMLMLHEDHGLHYHIMRNALARELCKALGEDRAKKLKIAKADNESIVSLDASALIDMPNLATVLAQYGIAVSAGAACSVNDDSEELSHVLLAMGRDEKSIRNTVRVSFTKYTEERDLVLFARALSDIIDAYGKGENQ